MEEKRKRNHNRPAKPPVKKKKKRIALWIVLGVLFLALIGGGIFVWHVLKRPDVFFEPSVRVAVSATPKATPAFNVEDYLPTRDPVSTSIPTPVLPDTPEPVKKTDDGQLKGIVNVALFGIDAFENGTSTSGTMPHTDANMIVAINFDTKEISLISIARDCMTTAPGYRGFYKFNGIFNVGGGMNDPKAGFELSCRAAEEWLGGVSVPYYYGVDFQALIDLVDLIGGIDFDLDITLYTFNNIKIYPGRRHLDGYGVMAYLRARKSAGGLDTQRTARQRKMLVAIFKKLKQEGKLSMVPDLLKTMGDNVYTNTDLAQTAALVNFAKEIDPDSIQSYSIQGTIHMNYDWAYCFIDQDARIELLEKVYGIDAKPMRINSTVYETFLHESGFRAIQYLTVAEKEFDAVHTVSEANLWTEEQKTAYARCWQDYQDLRAAFETIDLWTQAHYDSSVKLTKEEEQERSTYYTALTNLENRLKESANALNEAFGKPIKLGWNSSTTAWYGENGNVNEVYVDFR